VDKNLRRAAEKWDDYNQNQRGQSLGLSWWEAGSAINEHINIKISGSADTDWISYTLKAYFQGQLPLARCLSLGCGAGHLERRLGQLGAFEQCDAYDVSENSISTARTAAQTEGLHNISYYVADVNTLTLGSNAFDAIWISAAMHHFEALEHICEQMKQALQPGGLLILFEYVGPNRFQFPARQKEVANLCLQLLPEKYRVYVKESSQLLIKSPDREHGFRWVLGRVNDKIKDGTLLSTIRRRLRLLLAVGTDQTFTKDTVGFPSTRGVIADDPSEAIRSQDILSVIHQNFEIVEKRDWGGNVVQFLLQGIAGNFSDENAESQALIRMLFNIEDTLIQCGEFKSDFSYIVARVKGSNDSLLVK
jgi:2-polyprenyl-3-methyl-5-hydroxy-6-metoxy-1,4-benzoquinol methylase